MGEQWDGSGISDAWQLKLELFQMPYRPGVPDGESTIGSPGLGVAFYTSLCCDTVST